MKHLVYCCIAATILLASCSNERAARKQLDAARIAYQSGDLNAAKRMIDTIKVLYPKEFGVKKEGLVLMRHIERIEQERTAIYCDSLLQVKLVEVEPLKKGLVLQKDTLYEAIGNWISKLQSIERNVQRCYIRSGVSETGEIYLASVFYGKGALKHDRIKVSIPSGEYAETEAIPFDGGSNYRFEDFGNTTEIVTYRQPKDNGVIDFIYRNADQRLKVEYRGGKSYTLYMDDQAKRALKGVYDLGIVLADIERLKQERALALKRLTYLNTKLKTNDSASNEE